MTTRPDLDRPTAAMQRLRAGGWCAMYLGTGHDKAADIEAVLAWVEHLEQLDTGRLLTQLAAMQESCRELEEARDMLFAAVEHGDEAHRAWLKKAIDDHFAGRTVERPDGKGTTEALQDRIAELEEENKRLRSVEKNVLNPAWENTDQ